MQPNHVVAAIQKLQDRFNIGSAGLDTNCRNMKTCFTLVEQRPSALAGRDKELPFKGLFGVIVLIVAPVLSCR
jgi:hypothetical protein